MALRHVAGEKNVGRVVIYALSTCPWCRKTKALLDEMKVDYYFADVDKLSGEEREAAVSAVEKWNPACSFPTMIINDSACIVGFKEEEIRKALQL